MSETAQVASFGFYRMNCPFLSRPGPIVVTNASYSFLVYFGHCRCCQMFTFNMRRITLLLWLGRKKRGAQGSGQDWRAPL